MAVEQDVALLVQELDGLRAPTPGKTGSAASALAFTGSVVHFFDQSLRTITTEPSGIRPCCFSHLVMSATCRW